MEDSVSNTISIIGIPKTATTEQVITLGLCSFCLLKPLTVQLSFVFDPQILGAFADQDGAPMQGMKIKNVVPGKITSIFLSCFGAVERLHVPPSKFRFLRHSIFANVLLRGFCCLFVQALSIEAECVAVVTRQQRIWRIHYQQLENAIQCQSRGTSDRMCLLSAVYIILHHWGVYVDMWTYLKWRQLCWCFAC